MKKIFSTFALGLLATIGCAQVPAPSPQPSVNLACTASSDATSSYRYVFSRATCASASSCPANTSGNSNFVALNQSSPAATCAFTDPAPPTGFVIYTVSETANGLTGQPSAPSNGGTPISIPAYPGTPGTLNGTQVALLAPSTDKSAPVLAQTNKPGPTFLTAQLVVPTKK